MTVLDLQQRRQQTLFESFSQDLINIAKEAAMESRQLCFFQHKPMLTKMTPEIAKSIIEKEITDFSKYYDISVRDSGYIIDVTFKQKS